MRDLTKGSIVSHILSMAAPDSISMMTQIAYQLIDLYFVTRTGVAATAGVSAASNAGFILLALMQALGVGTWCWSHMPSVARTNRCKLGIQSMHSAVCGLRRDNDDASGHVYTLVFAVSYRERGDDRRRCHIFFGCRRGMHWCCR